MALQAHLATDSALEQLFSHSCRLNRLLLDDGAVFYVNRVIV